MVVVATIVTRVAKKWNPGVAFTITPFFVTYKWTNIALVFVSLAGLFQPSKPGAYPRG
jgi:hypothetical protein